jgi:hypothetical protein
MPEPRCSRSGREPRRDQTPPGADQGQIFGDERSPDCPETRWDISHDVPLELGTEKLRNRTTARTLRSSVLPPLEAGQRPREFPPLVAAFASGWDIRLGQDSDDQPCRDARSAEPWSDL